MPTRLQLARKEIIAVLDADGRSIFKQRDLEQILSQNRDKWRLTQNLTFSQFMEYLLRSRKLKRLDFGFPHRNETRFTWGESPLESVLLSLKPNCYFSHFTAVHMHDLTEQDPKIIYLNHEQRPKPVSAAGLNQDRIDMAFRRKPRTTKNLALVKTGNRTGMRICLLNGKHTGLLGIEERRIESSPGSLAQSVRLTDLERTLIDIAVRPFYSGGVSEVLKAYSRAADRVSVNRLAGLLRKLGHVYPYHQAVGYYLDASRSYPQTVIELFRSRFEFEYDFYLTYDMQDAVYNSRWRIHVPRGFVDNF